MGEELTPRTGNKSAPSDRVTPEAKLNRSPKSAPSDRVQVEVGKPRTGGDGDTPTSVTSNVIQPPGPRVTGRDSRITEGA